MFKSKTSSLMTVEMKVTIRDTQKMKDNKLHIITLKIKNVIKGVTLAIANHIVCMGLTTTETMKRMAVTSTMTMMMSVMITTVMTSFRAQMLRLRITMTRENAARKLTFLTTFLTEMITLNAMTRNAMTSGRKRALKMMLLRLMTLMMTSVRKFSLVMTLLTLMMTSVRKRALMTTLLTLMTLSMTSGVSEVTELKVGVLLLNDLRVPYSVHRVGPAVNIAMETVNRDLLNASYRLVPVLRVYDDICSARYATGVASDLYHKEGVVGYVGPACAYSLEGVARLAGFWNIPIITGLGDGGEFKNKTDYPTLTRFAYCQCRLRSVFGSVFRRFSWTNIAVIYDVDDSYSDVLGSTLKEGLRKGGYFPLMVPFYSSSGIDYEARLKEARKNARVLLLVVPGDILRQFMLTAYRLGYPQSGEFVFMDVELFDFPGRYWGDHGWQRDDQYDRIAREAYDALLRVTLYNAYGGEWANFSEAVVDRARLEQNFTFGDEEVNFFVGAFHDAVIRYGLALNETLTLGHDVTDGYSVARRMWNLTLHGVTGDVIIDDNGDRDTNFAVLDMDLVTGEFEIVANYWGANPGYTEVSGKSIHWPGPSGNPPPNRPRCGFTGDDPACDVTEGMPTYQIALMCLIGVIFFGCIIFFVAYRRLSWERDLRNMSWRVTFADVTFLSARADSFKLSMLDVDTMATMETDGDECKHTFTRVGLYQGIQVALKRIPVDTIDLTRQILLEIKMVRDLQHDNLTRFIGVCLEPQNNYVLNEYCSKGSLQDVLLNDSIKLDWTFRLSLLIDIAKAMKFLHHSPVQFHGRLRSTNCVVDSRFGLKVTDFGLPSFFPPTVVTDHEDNYHAKLEKLLWLAPEHLGVYCSGYRQTGGSQKGDVYGFGIIMEEVTLRSVPYDTQRGLLSVTEILDKVMKRENPPHRPKVPQREAPAQLNSLMDRCWSDVADLRPTFDVILKSLKSLTHGREVNLMETLITRLEDYASNLEDVVEDRTRQLAEEKKNSEILLYQILPKSVADQLKRGEPVTPEMYDNVTIYFSDIVGFTAMSAKCFPMQVVSFLNDLYSAFDSIIDDHDVYKVETIGDAYMVVSGLPERKGDQHAVEICRMALGLLQLAQTFPITHSPGETLQLRAGIHSGPCCAGVVGKKMPRYCLFGDTVNTASRMESTGQPLKIHLSETAKRILDRAGTFITQYRGPVEMKGKGVQDTYWLIGEESGYHSNHLHSSCDVKYRHHGDSCA